MKETLGATPVEDDEGLLLDLRSREELNRAEFTNINKAQIKYLLEKPPQRLAPFTYEWFLKLHKEMFGEVWKWAGTLRKRDSNLGVPWPKIQEELGKVLKEYQGWLEYRHDPIEVSAKIHHRLVRIHPFKNGNGRWARMVANIFLKQKGLPLLVWPEENSVVRGGFRERYLQALRKADQGDDSDLIKLHRSLLNRGDE